MAGGVEVQSRWSRLGRRGPLYTRVVFGVAVVMAVLELFVLEGEQVFNERIGSDRDVRVEIPLTRAGEPHLLVVYPRRVYPRCKSKLTVTVKAPDSEVLAEVSEWNYHKRHYIEFTPKVEGTYVLEGTQRYHAGAQAPRAWRSSSTTAASSGPGSTRWVGEQRERLRSRACPFPLGYLNTKSDGESPFSIRTHELPSSFGLLFHSSAVAHFAAIPSTTRWQGNEHTATVKQRIRILCWLGRK